MNNQPEQQELYYTFSISESGDISIHQRTKEQFLADLHRDIIDYAEEGEVAKFLEDEYHSTFPKEPNPMYWFGNRTLVIKGRLVVPYVREKEVVLETTID